MDFEARADICRYMIESFQDVVFLLDNHDRFVFLNDRIESLTGFKKRELLGEHFSMLVHPDDLMIARLDIIACSNYPGNEICRSIELRFRDKRENAHFHYMDIKILKIPGNISQAYSHMLNGEYDNNTVTSYGVARDVTQQKLLENIINTNINYDYLTGLPNRVLLKDRMELSIAKAKRERRKFVVMFIDLDGFKQVNDIYGHSAGDIVLKSVSARLKACLREADTLARLGGDEFILLLPDIHDIGEVRAITDKLLHEINRPFLISDYKQPLSASIGVALYPDNGETFDDLLKGADRAMYHIKHRTKNGYAFVSDLTGLNNQGNIFNFS